MIDEAFRASCYGEALAAISRYISEDLVSPPSAETLEFLGHALGRMMSERQDFAPEDFTLYAMSVLHSDDDDDAKVLRIRRGAMRYLLDVKPRLAPEFQRLSEDAKAFLREARDPLQGRRTVVDAPEPPPEPQEVEAEAEAERRPSTNGESDAMPVRASRSKGSKAPYRRMSLDLPAGETVDDRPSQQTRRSGQAHGRSGMTAAVLTLFLGLLVLTALAIYFALTLFLPA
ncbi:MAG: hypothetical protein AAF692_06920 [Pseudomonadota bacterium]